MQRRVGGAVAQRNVDRVGKVNAVRHRPGRQRGGDRLFRVAAPVERSHDTIAGFEHSHIACDFQDMTRHFGSRHKRQRWPALILAGHNQRLAKAECREFDRDANLTRI